MTAQIRYIQTRTGWKKLLLALNQMTIDKDSITAFNTTITNRKGNMHSHVTCTSAIGIAKPYVLPQNGKLHRITAT